MDQLGTMGSTISLKNSFYHEEFVFNAGSKQTPRLLPLISPLHTVIYSALHCALYTVHNVLYTVQSVQCYVHCVQLAQCALFLQGQFSGSLHLAEWGDVCWRRNMFSPINLDQTCHLWPKSSLAWKTGQVRGVRQHQVFYIL